MTKLTAAILELVASIAMIVLLIYLNSPWWGYLVAIIAGTVMNAARYYHPVHVKI